MAAIPAKKFQSAGYIFQVKFDKAYSNAVSKLQTALKESSDKSAQYKAQAAFLQALLNAQIAFWVVKKLQHYELAALVKNVVAAGDKALNTNTELSLEALKPIDFKKSV